MPTCPRCRDEYVDGVDVCPACGIPTIPDGQPLPPQVDRVLGTFHPLLAERIEAILDRRGIAHDVLPLDGDRVEVVVDREFRDDLRAELAVNWQGLVSSLDPDDMYAVLAAGGEQPGWFDAPRSAWIDREGRLQVEPARHEEDEAEARRVYGPMLLALGGILALFGWYADMSPTFVLVGVTMAAVGLFLPR